MAFRVRSTPHSKLHTPHLNMKDYLKKNGIRIGIIVIAAVVECTRLERNSDSISAAKVIRKTVTVSSIENSDIRIPSFGNFTPKTLQT